MIAGLIGGEEPVDQGHCARCMNMGIKKKIVRVLCDALSVTILPPVLLLLLNISIKYNEIAYWPPAWLAPPQLLGTLFFLVYCLLSCVGICYDMQLSRIMAHCKQCKNMKTEGR